MDHIDAPSFDKSLKQTVVYQRTGHFCAAEMPKDYPDQIPDQKKELFRTGSIYME
ncbi:MAG: hypothetical protein Q4D32_00475 [Eubacteriales bacterium]|nr:hypothetical protein [Eubacteriales bacterium]